MRLFSLSRRDFGLWISLVVGFSLPIPSASAMWADVAQEILVDQAHLIVKGKVARVEDAGFAVEDRPYDVAVIDVHAVLKTLIAAPAKSGKLREIRVAQPARGGLAVSTDIRFEVDQEGIWILTKDQKHDVYWARHPRQFQATKEEERLVELIKQRAQLKGGKPVGGLVARAELIESKPAKGPTFFEIRFSLKNVSKQPITVFDFVGDRSLTVDWTGPDGGKPESHHYDWLQRARLRAPGDENFVTIPPGGVHFLGPQIGGGGVYFQSPAENPNPQANVAEKASIV